MGAAYTAGGVVTKLTAFLGTHSREWQFVVANPAGDVVTSRKQLAGPRDPVRQSVRQVFPALHALGTSDFPTLIWAGRTGTVYNLVADSACEFQAVPAGCKEPVQTFMIERQVQGFALVRLTAADGTYGHLIAYAAKVATIVARTKPALEAAAVKSEAPVVKEPGRHRGKLVGLAILAAIVAACV